ncbi:MAG: aminotransferase class I/II-fold pyridoxal phosphate-dependent enzyme [Labilithrix sp.]|nr:aminotransferase class I/II-fold pyridoxal phosphate-dependent enzyme [Labilithrix sp.]
MREAILRAEVGDDVFGEDPTVRALEAEAARTTGKEAALFVTSGTMSNQLAIALHTRPGDEVIVGDGAHVVFYESGAGAALSGVQFAIAGAGGLFDADAMEERIHPTAHWSPRTSLVCVENTHNRAGGRVFPQADAVAIAERARARGLGVHLDGARLWNASVATGLSVAELAAPFDTVSVCFSKGLGAPVGSALCAPRAWIERARTLRKRWGGGMRQAGILAAGALYALAHHTERLREDHANARRFAEGIAKTPGVSVDLAGVQTNIVNVDLAAPLTAEAVAAAARRRGLAINASGPRRLRAVMHLDVHHDDVDRAVAMLSGAVAELRGTR